MQTLIDLIKTNSLKRGNFVLASGVTSDYIIDLKQTSLHPRGSLLIVNAILDKVRPSLIDAFGGMATGGIPLVAVLAFRSLAVCPKPIPSFFVRKSIKGHGTDLLVEGLLQPGMRTVLVEDVTTTGGSILQAVEAVRNFGAEVSEVVTVVDRLEGAADNLRQHNVTLTALLTKDDLLN